MHTIHADVLGPVTPATFDGNKYVVTFRDDFSSFTHVYLLEYKSEVYGSFVNYVTEVENKHGCKVVQVRMDNSKENT